MEIRALLAPVESSYSLRFPPRPLRRSLS